ncbi:MAG: putative membrane protein YfcA [Paraglaciecola sp.]|jgi:uncharacterized membrane protein YfcA
MELFTNEWLSPFLALGLIILAGITSFITAAFGAGGGLLLLVVMASILPMSAVIPVHGLVQLGSNANRMLLTLRQIDLSMLLYFSAGGIVGALSASLLVTQLPLELMKLVVGLFVLYLLWGATPAIRETSKLGRTVAGVITTFLSMFVGASGPMVGSYMYINGYEKLRFTATFSSCMTFQHSLKAIVYTAIGFSFWQWLPLIVAMVTSGALGTWAGIKLLKKLPAEKFKLIFRVIISLLCVQLIWQAANEWLVS